MIRTSSLCARLRAILTPWNSGYKGHANARRVNLRVVSARGNGHRISEKQNPRRARRGFEFAGRR
jgi:hypothetical protein